MSDPETIEQEVGRRIRAIRKELDLRQRDVAERTDLSTETISRIERGVQGVTFPNVTRIANALEVPLAEICDLDVETEELISTAKSHHVARLLDEASPTQIDLLMEMAETVLDWSRDQVDGD